MSVEVPLVEKYERNGWPSIRRPDLHSPQGWSLPLLAAVDHVRSHTLSPDGKQIACIWDRGGFSDVYTLPAAGGWPLRRTTQRPAAIFWDDELPRWSPDGRWLACTIAGHVHIISTAGGLEQKISDFTTAASSPMWLPNSRGLVVSIERHSATQLVLTDLEGSWPRALTNDPGGDAWEAQPSPDGKYIAYIYRRFDDLNRRDIRVIDLESGGSRTIFGLPQTFTSAPRWRPDSQELAFVSQQSGFYEICLVQCDGANLRQLTHYGEDIASLAWAPDGKQLACIVNRGGAFELDQVDATSGAAVTLAGGAGVYSQPCWSPGGEFLTVEYENPLQPPDLYRIDLSTRQVTQLTFSRLPALLPLDLKVPERIDYSSFDGVEIPAFLYRPAHPNGAGIVNPHGGPADQTIYFFDFFTQYLVAKGYTILAPNYRGSTGYGRPFERLNHNDWGGGDAQDCLYAADFLAQQPGVDRSRLASMGSSYGGYLTNCVLARDPQRRFACGVSKMGDANLVSSWAQCSQRLRLYTEIFLNHPSHSREIYQAGSPLLQADQVSAPLLILHGLADDIVPPEASEEWVEALRRAGKTFEYKTYAGEPHGFLKRENQLDAWERIERFLDWYLLPPGEV